MRLHVLSDLHLEFAPFAIPGETGAHVVVLAGDIGVGTTGVELALEQVRHAQVVYVPGNHEFYGATIPSVLARMRHMSAGTHVHVLENESAVVGGVRFLGCCLWTAFDALGEASRDFHMGHAALAMNDYHHILGDDGKPLRPEATVALHRQSRAWLESQLQLPHPGPTVVVTHHAAIRLAFPRWALKNPTVVSACVNRMEGVMGGARANTWIHGHTHWGMDHRVRGTRVVSNQRGYPHRPVPSFDPGFCIEIQSR